MTQKEFIEYYIKDEDRATDIQDELVALPCKCTEPGCLGWVMVKNDKLSIKVHCDLYL